MYKLTNLTSILRIADGAFIPADESNVDYQAYLVWVAEGNPAEPADPIPEPVAVNPMEKLKAFLSDNPDVVAVL